MTASSIQSLLQSSDAYRRLAIDETKQLVRNRFENLASDSQLGARIFVQVEPVEDYLRVSVGVSMPQEPKYSMPPEASSGQAFLDAAEELGEKLRREFEIAGIRAYLKISYGYYGNSKSGKVA